MTRSEYYHKKEEGGHEGSHLPVEDSHEEHTGNDAKETTDATDAKEATSSSLATVAEITPPAGSTGPVGSTTGSFTMDDDSTADPDLTPLWRREDRAREEADEHRYDLEEEEEGVMAERLREQQREQREAREREEREEQEAREAREEQLIAEQVERERRESTFCFCGRKMESFNRTGMDWGSFAGRLRVLDLSGNRLSSLGLQALGVRLLCVPRVSSVCFRCSLYCTLCTLCTLLTLFLCAMSFFSQFRIRGNWKTPFHRQCHCWRNSISPTTTFVCWHPLRLPNAPC